MKDLEYAHIKVKTGRKVEEDGEKLRGFFASKFKDEPLVHHHTDDVGLVFNYPKVHYAVIEGDPIISGFEEGKELVKKMVDSAEQLTLGSSCYDVESWSLDIGEASIGGTREQHYYRFLTPWLALNSENYEKYKSMDDWKEKKELLNSILTGNILSMCKGFNRVVDRQIYVHTHIDEEVVNFKGVKMIGFTGKFKVNFELPDFIGLGKGVSRGHGKIMERSKENNR